MKETVNNSILKMLGSVIRNAIDDYVRYMKMKDNIKEFTRKRITKEGRQAQYWLFHSDNGVSPKISTLDGFNKHYRLGLNLEYVRKGIRKEAA